MCFDQHHAVLVVSKPSPNQLFPGFGVVKVSVSMSCMKFNFKLEGYNFSVSGTIII